MSRPVILCIGTNNVIGDSLGPKVGDKLIMDYNINAYVYGFSTRPITGSNYEKYINHIKKHHVESIIIAVDACVGKMEDIGKIKYSSKGIYAGSALNKSNNKIGDIGILGVVASAGNNNMEALLNVEKSLIEKMSYNIAGLIYNIINKFAFNEEIKNISVIK